MHTVRTTLAVMALLGATTASWMSSSTTAMASASDCTGGANGFEDIADTYSSGQSHGSVTLMSGATVTLKSDTFGWFTTRGYAQLSGAHVAGARVWMDWTQHGGHGWLQCGPFGPSHGSPLTTPAQLTNSSPQWQFRACGDVPGVVSYKCTAWW